MRQRVVFQAEGVSGGAAAAPEGGSALAAPVTPPAAAEAVAAAPAAEKAAEVVIPETKENVLAEAAKPPADETPEAKAAREEAEKAAETPEAKATREAAEAEAAEKAAKEAKEKGEPEPLTADKLKIPEGMTADDKLLGSFVETANKHKLSAEAAQEFVDLYQGQVAEISLAPYKQWADTQKDWIAEIKADPEVGGKNFELMRTNFANALESVSGGDKAFETKVREALIYTGAGNNPAIVKFINRLAAGTIEGGFVGGNPPGKQTTAGNVLYGS